ncbi:homeodomain-interacting protein kinase 1-like [Xiphias gladius]|uniref:homeodomain-interacting protein kinase 1-like n=1 Tax=Xiphias gladius TaxID=8245 RepID=UPI001A98E245|nr:homeodomain-interacting protein kinase 1-like [Xiphias gladius]
MPVANVDSSDIAIGDLLPSATTAEPYEGLEGQDLVGVPLQLSQLLMAIVALKGIGVVHANLKPVNIMLVNHRLSPSDMWGLGCVLGFVYLRKKLFASHCVYQSIRGIVDILGQPADHLLSAGKHTHTFFKANQHWDKPRWWMKTPREYQIGTGIEPKRWHMRLRNLDDLITHDPRTQGKH